MAAARWKERRAAESEMFEMGEERNRFVRFYCADDRQVWGFQSIAFFAKRTIVVGDNI